MPHFQKKADPFYNSKVWKDLRKVVLERDKFTCCNCGFQAESRELQCDHILPRTTYPDLALSIGNLRTLCRPCHTSAGTSMGRNNLNQPIKKKPTIGLDGYPVNSEWSN